MTLVNTFTVAPDRADELLSVLTEATEQVMRHIPGFVSANLHLSDDRRHVINYAQWASREDFDAMLTREDAREHMGRAKEIAESFHPIICELLFSDEKTVS